MVAEVSAVAEAETVVSAPVEDMAAKLARLRADSEAKLKKASKDVPRVVKSAESVPTVTKRVTVAPVASAPATVTAASAAATAAATAEEDDVFANVHVPDAAELDAHEARHVAPKASDAVVFKHGKKTYLKMPSGALFKMGETKGEPVGVWDEATSTIVQEERFVA